MVGGMKKVSRWQDGLGSGEDDGSELFFFSSRRRHTRLQGDWSSDVCSSDLFVFGEFEMETQNGNAPLIDFLGVDLAVSVDRKSTRLNSSHLVISYAVFCLKKKK